MAAEPALGSVLSVTASGYECLSPWGYSATTCQELPVSVRQEVRTAEALFKEEEEVMDFDMLRGAGSLLIRTLSGSDFSLDGLSSETTIAEVKRRLADELQAPAFTIKLIVGDHILDDGKSLHEARLATAGASVMVLRCPSDRAEWVHLFFKLFTAIRGRDAHEARRLVDQGAGLDSEGNILKAGLTMRHPGDICAEADQAGNTMLHLAIRERLGDFALYLISRGVEIEATNDMHRSPLLQAVLMKQGAVTQALLSAKADVHVRDDIGNTALAYALRQGNDQLSAQLLSRTCYRKECEAFNSMALTFRARVVKSAAASIASPVWQCCVCGMPLTVQALLDAGAPITGTDVNGRTALHYAYGHNFPKLVNALLTGGADPAERDNFGWLPKDGINAPF